MEIRLNAPDEVQKGLSVAVAHPSVQRVIEAALKGDLSRDRPLKYWEPDTLNEQHLQVILMRAAGMRQREIADKLDLTENRVSIILNHPDAQTVLATVISHAADTVIDIRTRMKAHAGEMLDLLVGTARETKDENVRQRVAFGLLDRAGYGQEHKSKVTHEITVPAEALARLEAAIDAQKELYVSEQDWAPYIIEPGRQGSESPMLAGEVPPPDAVPPSSSPQAVAEPEAPPVPKRIKSIEPGEEAA